MSQLVVLLRLSSPRTSSSSVGTTRARRFAEYMSFVYDECKQTHNTRLWKTFIDVFNWLTVADVASDKVICLHGGLSRDMFHDGSDVKQQIHDIPRPADIPDSGFLCDLEPHMAQ